MVLLLVCSASLCIRPVCVLDYDLWWHLKVGTWISSHKAVPWRDVLVSGTDRTWIDYSWLFDVILSFIYRVAGPQGILAFTGTLIVAAVYSIFVVVSARIAQGYALCVSALYLATILPVSTPRPWLFSMLFMTIELGILFRAWTDRKPLLLVWLVPLFALWANLHIQFVYGLAVLACFAVNVSVVKRLKTADRTHANLEEWQGWVAVAGALLATLCSPYTWHLYSTVYSYAFQTTALVAISEMSSLAFRSFTDWSALALFCFGVGSLAWSRKKSFILAVLLLLGAWFGFRSGRDVWFMGAIAAIVGAECLRDVSQCNCLAQTPQADCVSFNSAHLRWADKVGC